MDQVKIGRFIAERRKTVGLTQLQLAEMLNITDRAVSKWETGKAMPDSSLMLELCDILKITVNDLLYGEVVSMDNYNKELENNLLQAVKDKEQSDKRLLFMEIVVGVACLVVFLALSAVATFVEMEEWLKILLILIGLAPLLIATPFMIKVEQTAGYYECAKCGHRYIPEYKRVFLAMHINRTRYMKCPKCNKRSWNKKKISKE
ncbi:MAG: helix-turn-helix transcriptional regulator [Ruminococcaceae bacterium]|nr:helix-turn-helix transcriptional regulator [Oscillospiraceae bacterium]